jgi:uncharacterized protein (DUF427 family)
MPLTIGSSPLGGQPGGVFNADLAAPDHLLYFEDSPRRVRAVLAGQTVADSTYAKLLHESNHLPVYYFPSVDVRADLLEPTDRSTHCPVKGDAAYWSIVVGERRVENAMWGYDDPLSDAAWLAGYRAFDWNAMDAWFEEDEQVFIHPRDPYTRIDVLHSSRHAVVRCNGEVLADSHRPMLLVETGLPVRAYVPRSDVRTDLLADSATRTGCPYKGFATYSTVRLPGGDVEDVAWRYDEPFHDAEPVRGMFCFDAGPAEVTLD